MTATPAVASPTAAPPTSNRWREVRVVKVVVNAGVGESGEARNKAVKVLQMVTGQKPISTRAKSTNRDFGIREGQEIGAKVTLRGARAIGFLDRAFDARDRILYPESIDRRGNFSFGIADYTDFSGMKYDPEIGVRGFDVCVEVGRPGYRVRERLRKAHPLPPSIRVSRDETRAFLVDRFKVNFPE